MWFRYGGTIDRNFKTNLQLSLFWKKFRNSSKFGKVIGKKLIASYALWAGHCPCWRMKNSLEIWRMLGRNCCNIIKLRSILLNNLDSVIGKYQTCVLSTTFDLPTDAIGDLTLLVLHCRRFVIQSVILRCGHCKYLFVGEQNDANVTGWIFLSNCFEWLSPACKSASLSSGSLRFLNTNCSQGSPSTHLRYGGVFNYCFISNLLLSQRVKEFWKSVRNWQSQRQKQSGTFFSR